MHSEEIHTKMFSTMLHVSLQVLRDSQGQFGVWCFDFIVVQRGTEVNNGVLGD